MLETDCGAKENLELRQGRLVPAHTPQCHDSLVYTSTTALFKPERIHVK